MQVLMCAQFLMYYVISRKTGALTPRRFVFVFICSMHVSGLGGWAYGPSDTILKHF
jgi:hypothetical protein